MKKFTLGRIKYFIPNNVAECYDVDTLSELKLLQLSSFAIKDNQFIKCRYDLEDVIKSFIEKNSL